MSKTATKPALSVLDLTETRNACEATIRTLQEKLRRQWWPEEKRHQIDSEISELTARVAALELNIRDAAKRELAELKARLAPEIAAANDRVASAQVVVDEARIAFESASDNLRRCVSDLYALTSHIEAAEFNLGD